MDIDNGGYILKSSEISLTLFCKIKLVLVQNKWTAYFFVLAIFVIVFYMCRERSQSTVNLVAEQVYKRIFKKIRTEKKVALMDSKLIFSLN